MFKIKMCSASGLYPLTVRIHGCPSSGVEAIDFRRKHGLPEEPHNKIELKLAIVEDEAACRTLSLNNEADYPACYRFADQAIAYRNGTGKYGLASFDSYHGRYPFVHAETIKAWNESPNSETALAVIHSVEWIDQEERQFAKHEAQAIADEKASHESKIAEARKLLKDELERKDSRIKYLEGELAEAREKIEELETEAV